MRLTKSSVWFGCQLFFTGKKKNRTLFDWNSFELTIRTFCIFGQQENWLCRSREKEGNLEMSVGASVSW